MEYRTSPETSAPSQQAAAEVEASIRSTIAHTDGQIGVNACAGSGKTHLIATHAAELRSQGGMLAVTLNRDAAQELRERGFNQKGMEARTFHSIGALAWRRHCKESKMIQMED